MNQAFNNLNKKLPSYYRDRKHLSKIESLRYRYFKHIKLRNLYFYASYSVLLIFNHAKLHNLTTLNLFSFYFNIIICQIKIAVINCKIKKKIRLVRTFQGPHRTIMVFF